MYTDGLNESLGPAGQRYGEPRVLNVVRASIKLPAPQIVDAVFRDLEDFAPGAMADDRTLLVLRR